MHFHARVRAHVHVHIHVYVFVHIHTSFYICLLIPMAQWLLLGHGDARFQCSRWIRIIHYWKPDQQPDKRGFKKIWQTFHVGAQDIEITGNHSFLFSEKRKRVNATSFPQMLQTLPTTSWKERAWTQRDEVRIFLQESPHNVGRTSLQKPCFLSRMQEPSMWNRFHQQYVAIFAVLAPLREARELLLVWCAETLTASDSAPWKRHAPDPMIWMWFAAELPLAASIVNEFHLNNLHMCIFSFGQMLHKQFCWLVGSLVVSHEYKKCQLSLCENACTYLATATTAAESKNVASGHLYTAVCLILMFWINGKIWAPTNPQLKHPFCWCHNFGPVPWLLTIKVGRVPAQVTCFMPQFAQPFATARSVFPIDMPMGWILKLDDGWRESKTKFFTQLCGW